MLRDLRLTLRQARRSPIGALVVVLTLGLGIGANLAVLAVIEAVLLRPLPYTDPDELVLTLASRPLQGIPFELVSYETYRDWRHRNNVFSDLAAVSLPRSFVLTDIEAPTSILAEVASSNYFSLLGVEPILGRTFTPDEELVLGAEAPVILSYSLWQGAFGGDAHVTDRTLHINGLGFRVVGVMAPTFRGLQWEPVDVWLPLSAAQPLLGPSYLSRTRSWLTTVGRLGSGVPLARARNGMAQLAAGLEAEYPAIYKDRRATLLPLAKFYFGPELRTGLRFLLLASLLVLLLCCINVGALFMVQALARRREIAIRSSLGAGIARLLRQFIVSAVVFSAAGAALAVLLARVSAPYLVAISDIRPATFEGRFVGLPVLAIAGVLALAVGGILGTLPPLVVSRLPLPEALKEGARSGTGSSWGRRLRGAFVTLQIGLGFVLLASAMLLGQSLRVLTSGNPGFDTRNLLTLQIELPALEYDNEEALTYAERLAESVAALAGVENATVVGPQLAPRAGYTVDVTPHERLDGDDEAGAVNLYRHAVLPGYFSMLGIPVLRGRVFTPLDDRDHPPVAVISQSGAELLWPGRDPIGQRLQLEPPPHAAAEQWHTIVGVVGDVRHRGFNSPERKDRDIYLSLRQDPQRSLYLLVRTSVDPQTANRRIRAAGLALDASLPLDRLDTMQQRFALSGADTRFQTVLVSIFAGLALLLAAIGVYGVLSLGLREQRRELALRIALGATPSRLATVVLRQCLRLLLPGLLLGFLGFLAVGPVLAATLHGVSATDPATLLFVAVVLAGVAIGTAIPPTLRATAIDPAASLRAE